MAHSELRAAVSEYWKRLNDSVWCRACWRQRYILRAIAIPVASPLDCSWDELRSTLRSRWKSTTAVSNWMMTELYTRDVRRKDEAKMPPMPRVYLYPEARTLFPGLPPQTIASIEQSSQRTYRAMRYQLVWTCATSLPTFRYPTPFPVHNQSWSAEIFEQRAVVSVRIADRRYRLRLRGGPQFHRQRAAFEQMASREAVRGELAIYERGDVLMVKMVSWLPRRKMTAEQREGNLAQALRITGSAIVQVSHAGVGRG